MVLTTLLNFLSYCCEVPWQRTEDLVSHEDFMRILHADFSKIAETWIFYLLTCDFWQLLKFNGQFIFNGQP